MDSYTAKQLLHKATSLGLEIRKATDGFPHSNTILRFLRMRSAELSATIVLGTCRSPAAYVEMLRTAFEKAHDTEFMLFYSLYLQYLPCGRVCSFIGDVHDVKSLIVWTIETLRVEL